MRYPFPLVFRKSILGIGAFVCLSLLTSYRSNGQPGSVNYQKLFRKSYYEGFKGFKPLKQHWLQLSKSKNVEDLEALSYGLDAILTMYEVTDSLNYLDVAMSLVNNNIGNALVTNQIKGNRFIYRDNYKGWIEQGKDSTSGVFHREVVLDEAYFYQYVCRLLRVINQNKRLIRKKRYRKFFTRTLDFVETNIWDKWISRGVRDSKNRYYFLLLSRTHMASHWAYIAAELYFLSGKMNRQDDYLNFVNTYNKKLEGNFHRYGNYISWNQTWDSNKHTTSIIQDVSHGNLVISYIVEAYDLGLWTDYDAIERIINTLKDKLWDPEDCLFRDNMDGTTIHAGPLLGDVGSFQSDGFVKLTRYDKSLFPVYEKFIECSKYLTAWYQYGQLFASLAFSKKILSSNLN